MTQHSASLFNRDMPIYHANTHLKKVSINETLIHRDAPLWNLRWGQHLYPLQSCSVKMLVKFSCSWMPELIPWLWAKLDIQDHPRSWDQNQSFFAEFGCKALFLQTCRKHFLHILETQTSQISTSQRNLRISSSKVRFGFVTRAAHYQIGFHNTDGTSHVLANSFH